MKFAKNNICKRKTTEQFIEDAKQIHGNKYDYSKVEYINNKTKVCIICPEHGEFWQTPGKHLYGRGCSKCSKVYRPTTNEWIEKAKLTHGDKYNYSKVEYINCKTKICIVCPIHGEFWQIPSAHLSGQGCPYCMNKHITNEDFIKKAIKKHNNKYTYEHCIYKKSNKKVLITCPIHGVFEQTPNEHLDGCGCRMCANDKMRDERALPINEFIERSNKIHGNKYDYSKVEYINNNTKVTIICSEHGEFLQTPSSHLQGSGCPHCHNFKLEIETKKILQENNIYYIPQHKFDWLINNKTNYYLSLDFYLPYYNIAIECQGGQHFDSVEHFGGEEGFLYIQERDKIKKKLCEEHGIKLLYYTNIKEYDTFLGEKVYHNINELLIENKIKK